jgi:N-acetylmuramoyl-L-alanine amidase
MIKISDFTDKINSRVIDRKQALLLLYSVVMLAGTLKVYGSGMASVFFTPTTKKIILLDAGHGGWDPGKIDARGRLEKDINLSIVKKLQKNLEIGGSFVFTTRITDTALSDGKRQDLDNRRELADTLRADMLVSVHQNSYPDPSVRGAQVFYYGTSEKSKRLAECIQSRMMSSLNQNKKRAAKANDNYYMLKRTSIPAVIVECGFMSNASDSAKLVDNDYQEKIAWAIYMGITDYFSGAGAASD